MTTYIQPPPPRPRGMGCLGKGCLILSCFILFLLVAGAIGIYWGLKHHSGIVRGVVWASKNHLLADQPAPVPEFHTTEDEIAAAEQKWKAFERAADRNEPAHIELSATDLNNLIAANPRARGKAFVSIEGNRARMQASLPVGEYLGSSGYYLNGEITLESDGPHSLDGPNLRRITINNHPVPGDVLDWQFKSRRLKEYLSQYQSDYDVTSVEVRDGKLILHRGAGD
jgi:hypothetical protein